VRQCHGASGSMSILLHAMIRYRWCRLFDSNLSVLASSSFQVGCSTLSWPLLALATSWLDETVRNHALHLIAPQLSFLIFILLFQLPDFLRTQILSLLGADLLKNIEEDLLRAFGAGKAMSSGIANISPGHISHAVVREGDAIGNFLAPAFSV